MEPLKHECGVAMLRLLKPLSYYQEKYGTWQYGLNKLYLLMEKQHNRGQEGAGIAGVNTLSEPGNEYIFRERALGSSAIKELYEIIGKAASELPHEQLNDPEWAAKNLPWAAQSLMGHLRYSTTGRTGISYVHPFLRRHNWKNKSMLLCGNFNLTNVDELFNAIVTQGQHPRLNADTFIMLEILGHSLDRQTQQIYDKYNKDGISGAELNKIIAEKINISELLRSCSVDWDGGYVVCGLTGDATSFVFRDPWGIRTAFYYYDDEVAVVASERPVIQTAFNLDISQVKELQPGEAIIIKSNGSIELSQIHPPKPEIRPCSFERIYFSRGSDYDVYRERKTLGRQLVPQILAAIDNDIENTVFSFIPNTAEVAYYGMMQGLEEHLNQLKKNRIHSTITPEEIDKILSMQIRQEKVAIKDIKLRTFIAEDNSRNDLATHVYDITYGSLRPGVDNLVIIDDSIVRGTTLKQSILKMLDRLKPKKIVVVSSCPQVRYPDYYGIDMSTMNEFVAFRAATALLKERGLEDMITGVYTRCKAQERLPKEQVKNYVTEIYAPLKNREISTKIAELLTPPDINAKVEIVYQTIEGLHKACPNHKGDWYFTGSFPTPGGNKSVNRSFIQYYENCYLKGTE